MQNFIHYLESRLFIHNDYGSLDNLIAAIQAASKETVWQDQKRAFNVISERAPFRDTTGYILTYQEVPVFIEQECSAWMEIADHG